MMPPLIIVPLSRPVQVEGGETAALVVRLPTASERAVIRRITDQYGEEAGDACLLLRLTMMAPGDISRLSLGDRRVIASEMIAAQREPVR